MKKIDYDKLISLLESEGYDVHMIGQDSYFIDRDDWLGIQINASRPITKEEQDPVQAFLAQNNGNNDPLNDSVKVFL